MSRRSKKRVFTEVVVIDAGAKGKSVAKADDGRVIFLSNAVPGDVVDIETFKKRKSFFEGKAINFHTLSDKRTTPKCEHFGVCGGCKWQHMDYKWQLHYKQNEVENNLKRIGHLNLPNISPIIPSKNDYFYRNKMEFSFSNNRWLTSDEIASDNDLGDRNALGFHIPGMWDKILDINKCWLQADPSNAIRNAVKSFAVENNLEFFDTRKQAGVLRTMMIRTTSTGELMVLIQFYNDDKEKRELLLNYISQNFPEITSLLYVINQKANDTIYDQEVICYNGRD
ncbi:MAG: class I SAM-dependent RNA methyltransferase, partial [Winogradskyella sp.]|nr:class I SAM-dependent RNA methyltransferase [Winogradskyella sp.]